MSFPAKQLKKLYEADKKSVHEIASFLKCSEHKVNYWFAKHKIKKRSISQAMYIKHNPKGDPFIIRIPTTLEDAKLFGLGVGLYWGEGSKKSKNQVRLGNTDPALIKIFIKFLHRCCGVSKAKLKFGLQIFSDIKPNHAIVFWQNQLGVGRKQFMKPTITPARSIGTYREKTKYGVMTVYFNNTKLRNILVNYCLGSSVVEQLHGK